MNTITVSSLTIYPIKSTAGLSLEVSEVTPKGLLHDRRWAVVDADNVILTAREYPRLLAIRTQVGRDTLDIDLPAIGRFSLPLRPATKNMLPVTIFGNPVTGNHISQEMDQRLSDFLGTSCRLIFMDEGCDRPVLPVYGGRPGDQVSYADSAPIMLVSRESLEDLNARMPESLAMNRFRPNIVIEGVTAYEEDGWKHLRIGEVAFEVSEMCKRCVLTTIDPDTGLKSEDQQPTRTLATYKRHPRGGVSFGVTLIPRGEGVIQMGDKVQIL